MVQHLLVKNGYTALGILVLLSMGLYVKGYVSSNLSVVHGCHDLMFKQFVIILYVWITI